MKSFKVRSDTLKVRLSMYLVVACAAAVTAIGAQKRPDFSGRWLVIEPAHGAGTEMVLKQTETLLTEGHDSEGGGHRLEYHLDGAEHTSTMNSHGMDIVTAAQSLRLPEGTMKARLSRGRDMLRRKLFHATR